MRKRSGLAAHLTVIAAAVACYAASYRRAFMGIAETADIFPSPRPTAGFSWIFRVLDCTLLTTPFQRAGFRFTIKSLLRNERQCLILGGWVGVGMVTAAQFLYSSTSNSRVVPSTELLAIPLVLSYCMIVGLRFAFAVPTEIRANWIFQLCIDKARHECAPLARKTLLAFVVPWLVMIVLPVYAYFWGWRVALLETYVAMAWSSLLVEILLLRFRAIPFTCQYPPFRDSTVVVAISYGLGFFGFVVWTAHLELWALYDFSVTLVLLALPWALGTCSLEYVQEFQRLTGK
jgi:hypothetical protein